MFSAKLRNVTPFNDGSADSRKNMPMSWNAFPSITTESKEIGEGCPAILSKTNWEGKCDESNTGVRQMLLETVAFESVIVE